MPRGQFCKYMPSLLLTPTLPVNFLFIIIIIFPFFLFFSHTSCTLFPTNNPPPPPVPAHNNEYEGALYQVEVEVEVEVEAMAFHFQVLRQLYTDTGNAGRLDRFFPVSEEFTIETGVKQSCVIAPAFLNCVTDHLMCRLLLSRCR